MNREYIRNLLIEESFAYGFTIAFWGSGILLINEYGLFHTIGVLAFAAGAVTGFGVLAIASFGGAVDAVETEQSPQYFVLAGIHYVSSLVPILITHLILVLPLGTFVSLFLAGSNVSMFYSVFAAIEESISKILWSVEKRMGEESGTDDTG